MRDRMLVVVYNNILDNAIRKLLEDKEVCGFTELEQVKGKGCRTGFALGTPVFPDINNMVFIIESRDRIDAVVAELKQLKQAFPEEGLKMFTVPVEER